MQTKQVKVIRSGIWILAAMLLVLLMISLALLSGVLGIHAVTRDTIALTPEESEKTFYQTLYRPVAPQPSSQTGGQGLRWKSDTRINLFQSSYVNDLGKETVKSESGDNIIAPGTSKYYTFSIRNTGNVALRYELSLDGAFAYIGQPVPLQFRLRRGDQWLVGTAGQWGTLAELTSFSGSSALNPGKIDEYLLEWQWPYDGEDLTDTSLGSAALDANAQFNLSIATIAEATGSAAIDGNGDLLYERNLTNRGIVVLTVSFAALLVLLFLVLFRRSVFIMCIPPIAGSEFRCGHKKVKVQSSGRFVFRKIYPGWHTFAMFDLRLRWRLKRSKHVAGAVFTSGNTVLIGRNIRAIELYLDENLRLDNASWSAIDDHNRVYSPFGIQEPNEKGENCTLGGLAVNRRGEFFLRVRKKTK